MLKISNLNKHYKDGRQSVQVLFDINLEVQEGEFVCVLGPSGCGKSTLLNIIGMMDEYSSDDYWFFNENIKESSTRKLAEIRNKNIGYIFQSFHLIPELNVLDNVALPMGYAGVRRKDRKERAKELLKTVHMEEKEKNYPNQLSGGEKQRTAIARAIANRPSLILADEPTGSLDQTNGQNILNILKQLHMMGTTIILVSHDETISHYATKIIRMKDGRIAD